MKLFVILAAVTLAQAAQLNREYLPASARAGGYSSGSSGGFGYTGSQRPQAARERNAAILRHESSLNGDTYNYLYETANGIHAEESGVATNGVRAHGGYAYTGDDGKVYSIRYTADENGFVPQGDHIPTPPPIPEAIRKALEQNARDEAAGIFDDGSYAEGKYGDNNHQHYMGGAQPYNYHSNTAAAGKAYLPPHSEAGY